jgi:hypothetical protein
MASDPTNGGFHDDTKTVTIRIFGSHDAAELAAANLDAHGIECWIKADDCGGMYPNLAAVGGGVRLLVRASDADAAVALLDTEASPSELNEIETEAMTSAPPEIFPLKKLAWGQILFSVIVGLILGVMLCLLYQWANNLGTKTYYHYTADGKRDEAWVYRDGHLANFMKDRNFDGVWDEWVYYEHGRAVRAEYDNNFDGKPDEWWTSSDDGTETMQSDTDFNGIPDVFYTYKNGAIQQGDTKPNGSKFSTVREIFQNGVLTEIERGGDKNGNFKEIVRYDPFFNPISTKPINTNIPTEFQLLTPSSK